MEVELTAALIDDADTSDLDLLALTAFGFSGRHRVLPDDIVVWTRWQQKLPTALADEIHLAWEESSRRDELGTRSERLRVVPASKGDFTSTPLELAAREALTLLGRPLRVLLENGRNDRAFLLAFAGASRTLLEGAEREGWLVFENAGGIGELKVRVEASIDDALREVYRTMYLCDSDALEPGQLSKEAGEVHDALAALGVRYAQNASHFGVVLARRAAENYAPPADVVAWAKRVYGPRHDAVFQELARNRSAVTASPGATNSPRRTLLAAIALNELRHQPLVLGHLDMKHGRGAAPHRTADAVWHVLDDFQKAALREGFGRGFAADFYPKHSGLKDRTGEIQTIVSTIVERL
ncbi:MAG: hypothetical protein U0414_04815 [Polyangiaceae bacterium]